jgi:hypothetical protein
MEEQYKKDRSPQGLFIQNKKKELAPIDLKDGNEISI